LADFLNHSPISGGTPELIKAKFPKGKRKGEERIKSRDTTLLDEGISKDESSDAKQPGFRAGDSYEQMSTPPVRLPLLKTKRLKSFVNPETSEYICFVVMTNI
jgi:hypothetical protein